MRFSHAFFLVGSVIVLAACGEITDVGEGAPVIESLDPNRGGQPGGTTVTVTGTDFTSGGDHFATVGGILESATVVDDTTLTFVTPPGREGPADVVVFNLNGASTAPAAFVYNPAPAVIEVEPKTFSEGGGDPVTVIGRGFSSLAPGANRLLIGSTVATDVTVVSDTVLTAMSGARADPPFEPVDVIVENDNGDGRLGAAARYRGAGLLGSTRTNALLHIDPATGRVSQAATLSASPKSIGLRSDGMLVAEVPGRVSSTRDLVAVDPRTGASQLIGTFMDDTGGSVATRNLASDAQGRLWGFSGAGSGGGGASSGMLVEVDSGTAQGTVIGVNSISNQRSLCLVDMDDNTLFMINEFNDGGLRTINKKSGVTATVGALTYRSGTTTRCRSATVFNGEIFAIAYVDRDDIADGQRQFLVKIDPSNLRVTEISELEMPFALRIRAIAPTPPGY